MILLLSTAEARTWTVSATGGGDFGSVQHAVDAAQNGDVIEIDEGSWDEDVVLDSKGTLTLRGRGRDTRIHGKGNRYAIQVVASTLVLEDLVVDPRDRAGGLLLTSASTLSALRVGVVRGYSTDVGGGLRLEESSRASIEHSVFVGNFAEIEGGGLYVRDSEVELRSTDFHDNDTKLLGGAVDLVDSQLASRGGAWVGNGHTAVFAADATSTVSFDQDLFVDNTADLGLPADILANAFSVSLLGTHHQGTGFPLDLKSSTSVTLAQVYAEGESAVRGKTCSIDQSYLVDNARDGIDGTNDRGTVYSECDDFSLRDSFVCGGDGVGGLELSAGGSVSQSTFAGSSRYGVQHLDGALSLDKSLLFDNDAGLALLGSAVATGTDNNFFGARQSTPVDDPNRAYMRTGDLAVDPGIPAFTTCDAVPVFPPSAAFAGGVQVGQRDNDGDSFCGGFACEDLTDRLDCDDGDANRNPGESERGVDGVDQDCDGLELCFLDADEDGWGEGSLVPGDLLCAAPGLAVRSGDCDDGNPSAYPGAPEVVGDGVDQSCDTTETCFQDADDDGYRTSATVVSTDLDCLDGVEAASSLPSGDCNDGLVAINPGAVELVGDGVDQNCNGSETCFLDGDGDGARTGATVASTDADCGDGGEALASAVLDCLDTDHTVFPGASEVVADGVDQDCDGGESCFVDGDGDGARTTVVAASTDADCADAGEALTGALLDCDDGAAGVFPGAPEVVADGIDQDCDGGESCFADEDGDGARTTATLVSTDGDCADPGEAAAAASLDCDDAEAAIRPGVAELVGDGVDQNCDGAETCFLDDDDDGARTTATLASADADCADAREGVATDALDCDDADAAIRPGVAEVAGDGVDQNCDGGESCFLDDDDDGARTSSTLASTDADCADAREGVAADLVDCDDGAANVYPGAPEVVADGVDQDCDGAESCFVDSDGDGARTAVIAASTDADCADSGEALASALLDCLDTDDAVSPGAVEIVADGVDQDCDGGESCHVDADGDGARTGATVLSGDTDCADSGEALASAPLDCLDTDGTVFPAAVEVVGDGEDQDCDGGDRCFQDQDGDGARGGGTVGSGDLDCADVGEAPAGAPGDCDDLDADRFPTNPEVVGDGSDQNCDGVESCYTDSDGDGARSFVVATSTDQDCGDAGEALASAAFDCLDTDADVRPGAPEVVADEVDQDCDGGEVCFVDGDGDGARGTTTAVSADVDCADAGEALAADLLDCDDAAGDVFPGATEVCDGGTDEDCDSLADDADPGVLGRTVFGRDLDGDGHGDPGDTLSACVAPSGYVALVDDCDDAEALAFPGAPETCTDSVDYNCDGSTGGTVDADGDGVVACLDCNDARADVRPGGIEVCDASDVDEDCDGSVDDADPSVVGQTSWRPDVDGDGHGDPVGAAIACEAPPGFVADADDCDDTDPLAYPGAAENCADVIDFNCDGSVGGVVDADGDGVVACLDCDDARADVFPGAVERCDVAQRDEDCDGLSDDADGDVVGQRAWFGDGDGDGYGDPGSVLVACEAPVGFEDDADDCDDTDSATFPFAPEPCSGDPVDRNCDGSTQNEDLDGDGYVACADCDDGSAAIRPDAAEVCDDADADEDCDTLADDADGSVTGVTLWYLDADSDGYGDLARSFVACSPPAGHVATGGDCDDTDPDFYPNAPEDDCNPGALDFNCDGSVAIDDADADGWIACQDCDDQSPLVNPSAVERCDVADLDEDCDGLAEDADLGAIGQTAWFGDGDSDGFASGLARLACDPLPGEASASTDCDDADPTVFPGAPESCGALTDQNCDGSFGPVDADGDGVSACMDCDDSDPLVLPGSQERCAPAGVDDDCDGFVDDADVSVVGLTAWYLDADGDSWGGSGAVLACAPPAGTVAVGGDCDDLDVRFHPTATEDDCGDANDYNCDGSAGGATDFDGDGAAACRDCDDTDPAAAVLVSFWDDLDGDGFGGGFPAGLTCVPAAGQSLVDADCDDADALRFPSAPERCNGVVDDCGAPLPAEELDADGDRYTVCDPEQWSGPRPPISGGDCDDGDAAVEPGAFEDPAEDGIDQDCDGFELCLADADGDGFGGTLLPSADLTCAGGTVPGDCDDTDPDRAPGQPEVPLDGVDQDCDGADACWADQDGDGAGGGALVPCNDATAVGNDDDCDDADDAVSPTRDEACNGVDDDCDGFVDDGFATVTVYVDGDGDGVGDDAVDPLETCLPPVGYTLVPGDCDDSDPDTLPGGLDGCGVDHNCDGVGLPCTGADADGDGFCDAPSCAAGLLPGDCDDGDPGVNPGGTEVCDGVDQDCSGAPDEGLDVDADGDGFVSVGSCGGGVADCDDADPRAFPGAFERCNAADDDCDGLLDEGLDVDADRDGWYADVSCSLSGGLADCDDGDPAIRPFAADRDVDGLDQNCDGTDGPPSGDQDADGDGFCGGGGEDLDGDGRCDGPADDPTADADCDDTRRQDHPGAPELPDGVDNDCDGAVDDDIEQGADLDGDGARWPQDCDDGDPAVLPGAEERCNGVDDDCDGVFAPGEFDVDRDGWLVCAGDCDDQASVVHPMAVETCGNGIDDNCSGTADDNTDRDGDGFSECDGDCWDRVEPPEGAPDDFVASPGAPELCDGFDNDCDAVVDEGFDLDEDGVRACPGCAGPDCDCDDFDPAVRPGRAETCGNDIDENCDGSLTNVNADGDPFGACEGDCDDLDPEVFPSADEVCNGEDDNCDGRLDEGFDLDADGVGTCYGDCDDDDDQIFPGQPELCNGADDDCDPTTDELESVCPPECEPEVCDDGLDNDCDGDADDADGDCAAPETGDGPPEGPVKDDEGCGCAAGAGAPLGAWVLALGALVLRRRATRGAA